MSYSILSASALCLVEFCCLAESPASEVPTLNQTQQPRLCLSSSCKDAVQPKVGYLICNNLTTAMFTAPALFNLALSAVCVHCLDESAKTSLPAKSCTMHHGPCCAVNRCNLVPSSCLTFSFSHPAGILLTVLVTPACRSIRHEQGYQEAQPLNLTVNPQHIGKSNSPAVS